MSTLRRFAGIATATLVGLGMATSSAGAGESDGAAQEVVVMVATWANADGRVSCEPQIVGFSNTRCEHGGDSQASGALGANAHEGCREVVVGTEPPLGVCSVELGLPAGSASQKAISRGTTSEFERRCHTSTDALGGVEGTLVYNSVTLGIMQIPVTVEHSWVAGVAGQASEAALTGESVFTSGGEQFRAELAGTILVEEPDSMPANHCQSPERSGVFSGTIEVVQNVS